MIWNHPRESKQTEQQTRVFIDNGVEPQNTPTGIKRATALPETALAPLHKRVVKVLGVKIKQTADDKNDKEATMQLEKEAQTTGASTKSQSEHRRE